MVLYQLKIYDDCIISSKIWLLYKKNIIGKKGDFITSPEISQVFGELIATWLIFNSTNFFKYNFNFLELGPGRAVLIQDILRTIKSLNTKLYNKYSIYIF